MAKAKANQDIFPNVVYAEVTESAANTLTFEQIQTGYGSLNKTGWVIHRIEYYLDSTTLNLVTEPGDDLQIALVTSNLITSLTLQSAAVVDLLEIMILQDTAVGFEQKHMPMIRDFSSLPGGGKLVLPYPIFLAAKGTALGSAATVACRISFTERELTDVEWQELVQQTRLLT